MNGDFDIEIWTMSPPGHHQHECAIFDTGWLNEADSGLKMKLYQTYNTPWPKFNIRSNPDRCGWGGRTRDMYISDGGVPDPRDGQWHRWKVFRRGTAISVLYDDYLMGTEYCHMPLIANPFMIGGARSSSWVAQYSPLLFDNIKVTDHSLCAPEPSCDSDPAVSWSFCGNGCGRPRSTSAGEFPDWGYDGSYTCPEGTLEFSLVRCPLATESFLSNTILSQRRAGSFHRPDRTGTVGIYQKDTALQGFASNFSFTPVFA